MHPKSGVECLHGCVFFQLSKAGDGILADPTRHDARKMRQIGSDVEGNAVPRQPSADPYAISADFGLTSIRSLGTATSASLVPPARSPPSPQHGTAPTTPTL